MNRVGDDLRDRFELLGATRDIVELVETNRRNSFSDRRLFLVRQVFDASDQEILAAREKILVRTKEG